MTILVRRGTPLCQSQLQARALDAWRDAELVVLARWDAFLANGAPRQEAFAAYVAALDAEAAAAAELAAACFEPAEAA